MAGVVRCPTPARLAGRPLVAFQPISPRPGQELPPRDPCPSHANSGQTSEVPVENT